MTLSSDLRMMIPTTKLIKEYDDCTVHHISGTLNRKTANSIISEHEWTSHEIKGHKFHARHTCQFYADQFISIYFDYQVWSMKYELTVMMAKSSN
jgi:hypothetical protein